MNKGLSSGMTEPRPFWNDRAQPLSLPREASVHRSQSSLESSDYRVGFEAVELSKSSGLQSGTQRSQSTLGCFNFPVTKKSSPPTGVT